ncbi:hypothetical protein OG727_34170 [Streptomyces caniferus]|uniref:Uncharacterized protein n=1 Tax=Streptomyces caniferus TaxID=285557 RepID=A0ABZ1VVV0_9ACTN|nr:hypothetical protein [Streptomyces caniferus]
MRSAREDEHPVTDHLPPLDAIEEMNQVLAAIQHLSESDAGPAERAAVYERKANLLDRIAIEDGRPAAAEQAADARARAARLRAEADQPENEASHADCIEPHRTSDGYVDCDGRPL